MLFAIFPLSDILISIGPLAGAVAMLFFILPLSDVLTSVGPVVGTVAVGKEHRYKRYRIHATVWRGQHLRHNRNCFVP
jgi:hypothetical protein